MFCVLRRRLYGEGFSRHPIRLLVLGVHVRLLSFVHDVAHDVALHKLPLTVCHTTDKTFQIQRLNTKMSEEKKKCDPHLELVNLPVGPDHDPVPLVQSCLEDVLGSLHLRIVKLCLGALKIFLEPLDQLQSLPNVGLYSTIIKRT